MVMPSIRHVCELTKDIATFISRDSNNGKIAY